MKHDVFVSHASDSLTTAEIVCRDLEAHGVKCWLAHRDAPPGTPYARSIEEALHVAGVIVVVVSPGAIASEHVQREVERASKRGLRLIPIHLESVVLHGDLAYFLSSLTFLEISVSPTPQELERLRSAVAGPSLVLTTRAARSDDRPVIALLPFRISSGTLDQDYLAEGLSDDLADRLSRISALSIIPAMPSAGEDTPALAARLRRELGAAYVLDGALHDRSGQIRVHARLIDTERRAQVWGEVYDADRDAIPRIQGEISDSIAARLGVEILDRERIRSVRLDGAGLGSWERLLCADWHARRLNQESNRTARAIYDELTRVDLRFAAAHGGVAMTFVYEVLMGWSDPGSSLALAVAAAERAVTEDDGLASAHFALGAATLLDGDPDRSLDESDRARSLHSSYPLAHWLHGTSLAFLDRPAEAWDSIQHAMKMSPHDPWMFAFMSGAGLACFAAGCLEEAVSFTDRSIRLRKDYPPSRFIKCASLALLRRVREAAEAAGDAQRVDPRFSFPKTIERVLSHHNPGLAERFRAAWRAAGIPIADLQ